MTSLFPLNSFSACKVLLPSGGTFLLPRCHLYGGVTEVKLPDNKDCRSCALFPVCMGGCPDDNIHSRNIIECDMYREHLVDRKLLEIRIHNRLIKESCTSCLRQ